MQYGGAYIKPKLGRPKATVAATAEILLRAEDNLVANLDRDRKIAEATGVADSALRDKYPALKGGA